MAGNAHLGFEGVEAEALLVLLDTAGVYAAAGRRARRAPPSRRTCSQAMGFRGEAALSSIRLSLGYASVDADVDVALEVVPEAVAKLRAAGSVT